MAQTLQSPGVSVSVIDQSFYAPAAPGTVPLIFVATEENKTNASGTGIAQGTTQANAGTVWVITSQRDLVDTFGTPHFQTASGSPVNASEINEYGLQAAYSVLGASSQAYIVRADIDLAQIAGSTAIPQGTPPGGTVWLDTADSTFGVNVWSATANNGLGAFSQVTPLIIDDTNYDTVFSGGLPLSSFGSVGSIAIVLPGQSALDADTNGLYYKSATAGWVRVQSTFDTNKQFVIGPNYAYPDFTSATGSNAPSGSIWVCTNEVSNGSIWDVKYYNSNTASWTSVNAPLYAGKQDAIANLDSTTGGLGIALNSIFIDTDIDNLGIADFKAYYRGNVGATTLSLTSATTVNIGGTFNLRETLSSGQWNSSATIHVSPGGYLGQAIAAAINTSTSVVNVSATWNASNNQLVISHKLGGEIELVDGLHGPLNGIGVNAGAVGTVANLQLAPAGDIGYSFEVSNWTPLTYYSQATAPGVAPMNGTNWFNSYIGDVDVMYNNGTQWVGYQNAFPSTDPMGPLVSASAPLTQSDGTALVTGDIWIESASSSNYGQVIYVYNSLVGTGVNGWVLQNTADHISPNGWLFADARWSNTGTTSMQTLTPITTLLTSNYIDPDAPSAKLYPRGTRLFNTRRSSNNVKMYNAGYINLNGVNSNVGNESQASYYPDRWVTASPNNAKGQGQFGTLAQRSVVVEALAALINTSTAVRDTDTLNYNLIACPGYTEVLSEMVNLNADIGQLALVVGDTPMKLAADATTLSNWGKNTANASTDGADGIITSDPYTAVYYPSGQTTDNLGNNIVVPPSHMMLHTIINSDNVSYPWFAPAGTRRGVVTNASSVGYVDASGNFVTTSLYENLRNVLSAVQINPIATLPGAGLVAMGQYTKTSVSSALNRVNVARLVTYIRRQLSVLAKPFLFEPNDTQTRNEIKSTIENLLLELVTQRGLHDYVVVCDTTNNTPTRIDQNELWVDIAIEPVKAVEFIYIPLRLLNTGAIASGNFGSQAKGSSNSSTGQ